MSILRLVRNFALLGMLALAAHDLAGYPIISCGLPCRVCGSSTPCVNHVRCYCQPMTVGCHWVRQSCQ